MIKPSTVFGENINAYFYLFIYECSTAYAVEYEGQIQNHMIEREFYMNSVRHSKKQWELSELLILYATKRRVQQTFSLRRLIELVNQRFCSSSFPLPFLGP
jgi:hypothetical protein